MENLPRAAKSRLRKTRSCASALRFVAESHRNDFRYARLLHGHAVHHRRGIHGAFAVRDEDELRLFAHLADHVSEASHVGFVQWRIYFIENAEWARLVL